jgi:PAS domain S-box-containing protein
LAVLPERPTHPDAAVLLRAEHAVARVLAAADGEPAAYPELLAAIGGCLGWDVGALWLPLGGSPPLHCAAVWQAPPATWEAFVESGRTQTLAAGEGLPGRVWTQARPDWVIDVATSPTLPRAAAAAAAGLRSAFAFPVRGAQRMLGVIEFFATERREPDTDLLATVDSLGSQIGQFVERCRAQGAVRESDARKSAILNAAFDCIVTMDHHGNVIEANAAAERTFGYTSAEMVGHELAALIIPPRLREGHRRGLRLHLESGESHVTGRRAELVAMRSDGSEFPVEAVITRPELPGPPLFCGYLRDLTGQRAVEDALRRLADEQAALRRVATAVATEMEPARLFALVTEEVGRLLDAQTSNMVRFEGDGTAAVMGGWSGNGARNVPAGATIHLDGDTAASVVWRTGRPARVDSYDDLTGTLAAMLRGLGFRSAVAAPITLGGRMWGAVIVSSIQPEPLPAGSEHRLASFADLASQALANAHAREELAASRARIVEAGDAERRRLERNLHDGAQQRLVSLSLTLRLAARRLGSDPELLRAGEELAQALQELRELARGIHPAVLTDHGLEPALDALAARVPLPVELEVATGERLPASVEVAAYYVVAEALTNVARYAEASEVRVRVVRENGNACVEIADDGVGGALSGGSGLRGLADRVEALGGRLELESPVGVGTVVRASIPVA